MEHWHTIGHHRRHVRPVRASGSLGVRLTIVRNSYSFPQLTEALGCEGATLYVYGLLVLLRHAVARQALSTLEGDAARVAAIGANVVGSSEAVKETSTGHGGETRARRPKNANEGETRRTWGVRGSDPDGCDITSTINLRPKSKYMYIGV